MKRGSSAVAPYLNGVAGRRFRPLSLLFIIAYAAVTGVLTALLPPDLLWIVGMPLLAAVPVILWLLPDGGRVPEKLIGSLLLWFIGATVLWPEYLSVDLPGLPWINPPRLIALALLGVVLWSYSVSATMRSEVAAALNTIPILRTLFWVFWAATVLALAFSGALSSSLKTWIGNQFYWTFLFVLAAWIAIRPGVLDRASKLIVVATIVVSVVTIYEYHIRALPWLNYIPAFLTVDQTYLANVLKVQSRAGTDIYRAHGPFSVALVCAEYLAVVYPLLIHALIKARGLLARGALALALVAALAAMWFTNARSAMIGFFLAVFLYGGFAALRYWRRNRQSLVGVSTVAMAMVVGAVFVTLMLTWTRLHNMTIGGGQHESSSEARTAQWEMGTPKIIAYPLGHGTGRSGTVLGYANAGGQLTVDTYYLTLLLDYGVFGFGAFFGIFLVQLGYGLRMFFEAKPGEEDLAGPITIALINFLVIKSVLSLEFNMPIAFIFLGFLFALAYRQQLRTGQRVKPIWSSTPAVPDQRGLVAA